MNKLGRKKVIAYALVLAAALIGLVVDRLGRAPNDTGALVSRQVSAASPSGGPVPVPAGVLPVAHGPAGQGPPIAHVFENAPVASGPGEAAPTRVGGVSVRNAFGMAAPMRDFYEAGRPDRQAREQEKLQSERERLRQEIAAFQASHKLKGTTLQENLSWAIVDDSIVRLGDKIEGFELKSVERYRAVFVRDEVTITLSLPFP